MRDMSLHILDIAENSVRAGASVVEIEVTVDRGRDMLAISVRDDGRGMDDPAMKKADPFFTSKQDKRFGLGLPLFKQAAEECGGSFEIDSEPGRGTMVRAEFQLSHPDLKPLGDMGATLAALVQARPGMDFVFRHALDGEICELDTRGIRSEIEGLPLDTPAVLGYIKQNVNDCIRRAHV